MSTVQTVERFRAETAAMETGTLWATADVLEWSAARSPEVAALFAVVCAQLCRRYQLDAFVCSRHPQGPLAGLRDEVGLREARCALLN